MKIFLKSILKFLNKTCNQLLRNITNNQIEAKEKKENIKID
jgi:hypothetical protein